MDASYEDLPGELDVIDAETREVWRCQQIDALRWDYRLHEEQQHPWQTLMLGAPTKSHATLEALAASLLAAIRDITGARS